MTGEQIKKILKEEGISLREVAAKLGYNSDQRLHNALRGNNVKSKLIEEIAKAVDKPVCFFYDRTKPVEEKTLSLSEIITQLMEYAGCHKVTDFQSKIKVKTAQAIREILKGKTKTLSYEMESNIKSAFPEVSVVWLRTGNGSMLKADRSPASSGLASSVEGNSSSNVVDVSIVTHLLDELDAQRRLTEQSQAQNARLITLLEKCCAFVAPG